MAICFQGCVSDVSPGTRSLTYAAAVGPATIKIVARRLFLSLFSIYVGLLGSVCLGGENSELDTQSLNASSIPPLVSSSTDTVSDVELQTGFKFSSDDPAGSAEDIKEVSDWLQQVDEAFGRWLVKPLASVLFFDFGTKSLLGTSVPFVVVWLVFGGVFLTLRMSFINIRGFKHAIELLRGKDHSVSTPGDVSHFQALTSALSGTVGLGNIAGVAIAIGQGGPGATFWMIVCGFLGMTSKFAECTLALMYRNTDVKGRVIGGPMVYLRDGLSELGLPMLGKVLAVLFALLCIGGSLGIGNAYQVAQSMNALMMEERLSFLHHSPWLYGVVMSLLVGVVIVGGIQSIGRFASIVVPFMAVAYASVCFAILGLNADKIPWAVSEIFRGAFTPDGVYGGLIGVIVLSFKRACFSNEAGAGAAAIAHAAAKTHEPVTEGIVALLEPFIDTVCFCTLTALTIIVTGIHAQPEVLQLASENKGSMITLIAFTQNPDYDWFKYVLYLSVFLFAYSTCVSWSYYGERCCVNLFGERSSLPYKLLFLSFTFLGSVVSATNIMDFSDMMILAMTIPNLLGVLMLSRHIRRELDTYWDKHVTNTDNDESRETAM